MAQVHILEIEDCSEAPSQNEIRTDGLRKNISLTNNPDHRCRELSCKFRPILRLMKLTGEYYGDTSLDEIPRGNPNVFWRFYYSILLLGQWSVLAQAITSIFYEGVNHMENTYFLLTFSIWYLQCAVMNTMLLFIMPKSQKKSSRFSKFIRNLSETASDFSRMTKRRVRMLLALTCCLVVCNCICIAFIDFQRYISVARFRPWNGLLAYRLLHLVFAFVDSFAWITPVSLFCVSCLLLSCMFESLQKKISTYNSGSINIGSLRQEHQNLCETVAFANKVFSPLLSVFICALVPLICLNLYQLVKCNNTGLMITVLYWFMGVTGELTVILMFGIRVNEKVSLWLELVFIIKY